MRLSAGCIIGAAILAATGAVAQAVVEENGLRRSGDREAAIEHRPPLTPTEVLASEPHARVIVELRDPRITESNPSSANNRQAIADLQSEVLSVAIPGRRARALSDDPRYGLRLMSTVPAFAITVDRAELERLQSDPRVLNISSSLKLRTQLDQSTKLIGMKQAWAAPYKAQGAKYSVAIIDEGVNLKHKFLENTRIIAQACFSGGGDPELSFCPNGKTKQTGGKSGKNCPKEYDCDHGTHVAGIAAGYNTDRLSGEPKRGVARKAKIIAVQVFSKDEDPDDFETVAYTEDMLAALDWLYRKRDTFDRPLAAINMSIGNDFPFTENCDDDEDFAGPIFKKVIDQLRSANIATVISSGNEGFRNAVNFPACISTAVTVGASTKKADGQREQIAYYSNIGQVADLLAPGGDYFYPEDVGFSTQILSSVLGNKFEAQQGTSMAAPHVAGLWAAIRSVKGCGGESVDAILKALKKTGKKIPDAYYAKKRANVPKALDRLGCATAAQASVSARLQ